MEESVTDFSFDVDLASPALHDNVIMNVNEQLESDLPMKCATPEQTDPKTCTILQTKEMTSKHTFDIPSDNKMAKSNSDVHIAKKIFPRAPRKKLIYASEASENYRKSLESKNKIKSNYYEKKIAILERVAIAKEKSAAAKERSAAAKERSADAHEEIAQYLGRLTCAIEGIQDAIS